MEPGLTGEARGQVGESDTAIALGSGQMRVYGTPAMIALMEKAACNAVENQLPAGHSTVGIALDVRHLAATPVGLAVVARASLKEVHGNRLVFSVEAFDAVDKIGEGRHERFVVDVNRFLGRAEQKSGPLGGS